MARRSQLGYALVRRFADRVGVEDARDYAQRLARADDDLITANARIGRITLDALNALNALDSLDPLIALRPCAPGSPEA